MAEVPDLVAALDMTPAGPNRFVADNVQGGERGMVFGGELIAKMLVAAGRADGAKPVKAAHGLFGRTVQVTESVELDVDFLHRGRTFASASVSLLQGDRECARALVLLSEPEEDFIRHASPMPDVEGPDASVPLPDPSSWREVRSVGGVDINDETTVGPAELSLWMRFPTAPDETVVSQGLLAHATAGYLIGTAMRPHEGVGQSLSHRAMSTGIIGHTISFHEDFDPHDWLLIHHDSPFAGRGRTFGRGAVFTQDGQLVASFSQEAMIRHFAGGQAPDRPVSTVL
ncbi:MAG TPA: acyl-CoA thioesterase domain-containing protein [Acidimicrobiales bacterium]|nr:acyl-CoA thioesterase domain-containing protein [Acidimicrobiales bacterium]